jgi:DNA polymerase-3 subunit delta
MSGRVFLLTGQDYLAEDALDRVRAEAATDPLSEVSFDAKAEVAEIVEALSTSSLLGGKRLVVVRDAQDLNKQQAEAIAPHVEEPSPDTVLVLIAGGKTKFDAVVKKHGTVIGLDAPKGRRLVGWLRERARAKKLKIDDRAAWTLIDAAGTELRDLDSALEQLVTGMGEGATVTQAAVRQAFPRQADERIYAFTDAVGERKLPGAMTALRRLLDQGDEPLMIFGALTGHVRRLLRARRYADGGARAVGDALGMPEWRAERMLRQVRAYREEELIGALDVLARTDVEMKGDFPSPQAALERAVIEIVGERN